jgi:DNA invertase Pin-like site-specific DNA recombinase
MGTARRVHDCCQGGPWLCYGPRSSAFDTGTAAGKCFLDMLGVFAEFETNLRRERQLEGIADAKARGVYRGRKASIDPAKVTEMRAQGMGASAIAKALKIGRASGYRALEA